jgi:alcohol dehydrogenase/S-(hydroxymethyl)glutathione dehydrogenase/alcohol dehydrogenase
MDCRAAVFREIGSPLSIERITIDEPAPTELLVRIAAVGLCCTDYHVMRGERRVAMAPMVLGHEAAGIVDKTGAQVAGINVGDHVVLSFIPGCGRAAGAARACITSARKVRASGKGPQLDGRISAATATALSPAAAA